MRIIFSSRGWSDYQHWIEVDRDMLRKLNSLIKDVLRDPFRGIGKPEPLRNEMAGFWSRRITDEHRLVYRVSGTGAARALEIAQCRFHY